MGIGNNADFVARMEAHAKKRIDEIKSDEMKKRCILSTKKYKLMGEEKAKKVRAEAFSLDLRRWI